MAALYCLLLGLVSAGFHHPAEAANTGDTDRVIAAYNTAKDNCKQLTASSRQADRLAANHWCEQAFGALDGVKLNFCSGWRYAECRPVKGHKDFQCTCMISKSDQLSGKNDVGVTHFRDCAPTLWNHEPNTGTSATGSERHEEKNNFKCSFCHRTFKDAESLKRHKQYYDEENKYWQNMRSVHYRRPF